MILRVNDIVDFKRRHTGTKMSILDTDLLGFSGNVPCNVKNYESYKDSAATF